MPPQLTEGWATVYLEILIGLLVFAVGIPSLAFQLIVQEDVRQVTQRHMKVKWLHVLGTTILFTSILFVWIIHPSDNLTLSQDKPKPQSENIPQTSDSNTSPADDRLQSQIEPEAFYGWIEWESYLASIMVTIPLVSILLLSFVGLGAYKRENVVQSLERNIQRNFDSEGSLEAEPASWRYRTSKKFKKLLLYGFILKRIRRNKSISESSLSGNEKPTLLDDLILLGEQGRPGFEKKLVINALGRLAKQVQSSEKYKGRELECLIRGFKTVLINNKNQGNESDFHCTAEILKSIWNRFSGLHLSSQADQSILRIIFSELASASVASKSDETAMAYLGLGVIYYDSDIIFEIGLLALRSQRNLIATIALNNLETLAEDVTHPDHDAIIYDLLGLLAHFISSGGTLRKRASLFLARTEKDFQPSLQDCIERTREYHYNNGNYETADSLSDLLQLVKNRRWMEESLDENQWNQRHTEKQIFIPYKYKRSCRTTRAQQP